MGASDLAARVRELLSVDREAFDACVEREVDALKRAVHEGTFDNTRGSVGLEVEFYGVDAETDALMRVPRRLLELIGFEKELGLHNAEMQTTPQPLSKYGLRAQEAEVQARLEAAQTEATGAGIRLVCDGMWTVPPTGETADSYLTDSIEQDGVRIAANMSDAERYHAMANTGFGAELCLEAPHVSLPADTVMPESLITSIQPHYQVSQAADMPDFFAYALRIAGPLLALSVNSPFFPPELYDDVDDAVIVEDAPMENRVHVFESMLNPPESPKVAFPKDLVSAGEAIDRIAADVTVVPCDVEDTGRYDDLFRHLRHKHGTYWRWVRPVFDGATRRTANARIEFRPLPGQPTVRDVIALEATYAGLLESLYRREHPLPAMDWARAERNFYEAAEKGLRGEFHWVTADGVAVTDTDVMYEELFDLARDGLALRGLNDDEIERYVGPLEERVEQRVSPARWKHDRVRRAVDSGVPLTEAIWGTQAEYIDRQEDTLIEGSFVDWL